MYFCEKQRKMGGFADKIKDAMLRRCRAWIGDRVLVTLSGGADSVALLDALSAGGFRCVAAHCNFHLRGEESDRDCRYASALAQRLGVEIHVRDFDVPAYEKQHGVSTEMACRELRYEWFERLRAEIGCDVIAVAHHRDDNVETFFLNLLRGTGISGLTGMAYRNGNIVRPMLDCSRAEVEEYLAERGIEYVTDSTNLENEFKRNRLRNIILPMLNEQFPGACDSIANTLERLRSNEAIYRQTIARAEATYRKDGEIDVARLKKEEPEPETLLFEMIRSDGFNFSQAKDIIASASSSGKRFHAGGVSALLDRGMLKLSRGKDAADSEAIIDLSQDVDSPIRLKVLAFNRPKDFSPVADANKIYLDADALSGNPAFTLRRWRKGDRLAPFGMRGTKKLSDIFSDAKLSLDDKEKVWLLTRNDEILWIVGMRSSRHFAVKEGTSRVLSVEYLPE